MSLKQALMKAKVDKQASQDIAKIKQMLEQQQLRVQQLEKEDIVVDKHSEDFVEKLTRFYIINASGETVNIRKRSRADAQNVVDRDYGVGKYRINSRW